MNHLALVQTEESPVLQYLSTLGAGSRRSQAGALNSIARMLSDEMSDACQFPWERLTVSIVGVIRSTLEARYAPATANRHMAALRGVLKALWRSERISTDAYMRMVDVPSVPGNSRSMGRALTDHEISGLMEAAARQGAHAKAIRDQAIIALGIESGLRVSEICGLCIKDYVNQAVLVRRSKGNKSRIVPINRACYHINQYLKIRTQESFRPVLEGQPLFVAWKRVEHMHPNSISSILRHASKAAAIDPVTAHDMRRTYISRLLERGVDLATVARLAGHSKADTTRIYDKRPLEAARAAVESLGLPF